MKVWQRQIRTRHRAVGPKHDPYARDYTTVRLNGISYTIVDCSFECRSWIEVNGRRYPSEDAEACFERLTGMTSQWAQEHELQNDLYCYGDYE